MRQYVGPAVWRLFFGTTSRGTTYDSVRDVLRSIKCTLAKTVSSATWPLKTPRKVNTLSGKVAYGLIWAYPGSSGPIWIYLGLLGPSGAFNHPGGCYTMCKCTFWKMYKNVATVERQKCLSHRVSWGKCRHVAWECINVVLWKCIKMAKL